MTDSSELSLEYLCGHAAFFFFKYDTTGDCCVITYVTYRKVINYDQWRSKLNNWGHIFIYSCSAQLISFEIDCFHGL